MNSWQDFCSELAPQTRVSQVTWQGPCDLGKGEQRKINREQDKLQYSNDDLDAFNVFLYYAKVKDSS